MKRMTRKEAFLKKAVANKLKSTSGESIAETLVAVLISAFALLMLAGTVNTASSLITKSQDALEAYYEKTNQLAEHNASIKIPGGFSLSVSGGGASQTWSGDDVSGYQLTGGPIIGSRKLTAYD